MKPYTYLIGWSQHDKWYYGVRYAKTCDPTDLWKTYFTSSERVAMHRLTHGEPDVVQVRKVFDTKALAQAWEDRVLRRARCVQSVRWINGSNGGKTFNADHPITRARVAAANRGKKRSAEQCARMVEAAKSRPRQTEETRALRSTSLMGHKWSEATHLAMSKPKTAEARQAMSKAALNMTAEHRVKISAAKLNQSDETRRKIAESVRLVWERRRLAKATINTVHLSSFQENRNG